MIVLGIDPGSVRIGYGLIEKSGSLLRLINCGTLESIKEGAEEKILEAATGISRIIKKYRPELVGIEKIYFSKNVKTGIAVAQTRGAIILEISKLKIPIKELSPSEVKLAVAGYGLADKKAISKMVSLILSIKDKELKVYDDATDALAIAITAANNIIKGD